MPRYFPDNSSIQNISQVLNTLQLSRICPTSENCMLFPEKKGIYFWYITKLGLDKISKSIGYEILVDRGSARE